MNSSNDNNKKVDESFIEIYGFDFDGTLTSRNGDDTTKDELYDAVVASKDITLQGDENYYRAMLRESPNEDKIVKRRDEILGKIKGQTQQDQQFYKMAEGARQKLIDLLNNKNCRVVIITKNVREYTEAILKYNLEDNGKKPEDNNKIIDHLKSLKIYDMRDLNKMPEGKCSAMKLFIEELPAEDKARIKSAEVYDDSRNDLRAMKNGASQALKGLKLQHDASVKAFEGGPGKVITSGNIDPISIPASKEQSQTIGDKNLLVNNDKAKSEPPQDLVQYYKRRAEIYKKFTESKTGADLSEYDSELMSASDKEKVNDIVSKIHIAGKAEIYKKKFSDADRTQMSKILGKSMIRDEKIAVNEMQKMLNEFEASLNNILIAPVVQGKNNYAQSSKIFKPGTTQLESNKNIPINQAGKKDKDSDDQRSFITKIFGKK